MNKLALAAICLAGLCGNAMAQDAKTAIGDAQKALGDPKSITYSGSAKDVAFQQCGTNAAASICQGTHDPMRPIASYVRVIDLAAPASRHTGATNNPTGGGATIPVAGTFFQQVTPEQANLSQPWAASVELYLTPWGFLKGAAENTATASRRRVDGKNYTVLTWSPAVKAPSGKSYVVNGYVGDDNLVHRVETWLGDNIMGDMHVVASYTGWKDFGGAMAPAKIVRRAAGGRSLPSTWRRPRRILPTSPRWFLRLRRPRVAVVPAPPGVRGGAVHHRRSPSRPKSLATVFTG